MIGDLVSAGIPEREVRRMTLPVVRAALDSLYEREKRQMELFAAVLGVKQTGL